eukprot:350853-Chlamydomonas_euryale.AAC.4
MMTCFLPSSDRASAVLGEFQNSNLSVRGDSSSHSGRSTCPRRGALQACHPYAHELIQPHTTVANESAAGPFRGAEKYEHTK